MYFDLVDCLSQDSLAKLFRPKNALLNRSLSLTIDDLQFTSYPCPLSPDANSPIIGSSETEYSHGVATLGSNSNYVISMFNIVIVSATGKALKKINPDIPYRCQLRTGFPGTDPIAVAAGIRDTCCAICSQSIKR